jgi:hypothetical protein
MIRVTEADIEKGGRGLGNNPVARAVRRTAHQKWAMVGGRVACRLTRPRCVRLLPYAVMVRWRTYRCLGLMQPFEFELDVPATNNTRQTHRVKAAHQLES